LTVCFSCYVLYGSDFRRYSPHDFTSAFNAARSASKRVIRSDAIVIFCVYVDISSLKELAYHMLSAKQKIISKGEFFHGPCSYVNICSPKE
ncbi:hypothetical protein BDZ91DRAFT_746340, partial [Kalaharituber pfeilii]